MYHSINIGNYNTWDDWHLVPTSRPLVNPPSVKTSYVDLPGGDGVLDLSTALTGRPLYGNRTGEWTFLVMNDYEDWAVLYMKIVSCLHGKTFTVTLEDEPDYYYEGRLAVKEWVSGATMSSVTIQYNLDTYKQPLFHPAGVTMSRNALAASLSTILSFTGQYYNVTGRTPWLYVSASNVTLRFEGRTYTLKKGWNYFDDIVIKSGSNTFTFSYTTDVTITIELSEGRL